MDLLNFLKKPLNFFNEEKEKIYIYMLRENNHSEWNYFITSLVKPGKSLFFSDSKRDKYNDKISLRNRLIELNCSEEKIVFAKSIEKLPLCELDFLCKLRADNSNLDFAPVDKYNQKYLRS